MAGRNSLSRLAAAALMCAVSGFGAARDFLPDWARLQFAGSQGFLSAGVGYGFLEDRIDAAFLYGYLPWSVGGVIVHTLSAKTTVAPLRLKVHTGTTFYPVLAGVSAIVGLGDDYFLILPPRYREYYWPSALRLWYFAGTRIRQDFKPGVPFARGVGLIFEIGATDAYWRAYNRNRDVVLADILSISISSQLFF